VLLVLLIESRMLVRALDEIPVVDIAALLNLLCLRRTHFLSSSACGRSAVFEILTNLYFSLHSQPVRSQKQYPSGTSCCRRPVCLSFRPLL
jgi:hypothetical protein